MMTIPRECQDCDHCHVGTKELSGYVSCDRNEIGIDEGARAWVDGQPRTLQRVEEDDRRVWVRADAALRGACAWHSRHRARRRDVSLILPSCKGDNGRWVRQVRRAIAASQEASPFLCKWGCPPAPAYTTKMVKRTRCNNPNCPGKARVRKGRQSRPGATPRQLQERSESLQ